MATEPNEAEEGTSQCNYMILWFFIATFETRHALF